MSEQQIKTIHELTEDERVLLKAIVEGPAFAIMKKIAQKEILVLNDMLVNEKDKDTMFRLQGRIVGIKSFVMVPQAIVMQHRHESAQREKKSNKKNP